MRSWGAVPAPGLSGTFGKPGYCSLPVPPGTQSWKGPKGGNRAGGSVSVSQKPSLPSREWSGHVSILLWLSSCAAAACKVERDAGSFFARWGPVVFIYTPRQIWHACILNQSCYPMVLTSFLCSQRKTPKLFQPCEKGVLVGHQPDRGRTGQWGEVWLVPAGRLRHCLLQGFLLIVLVHLQ